jgi:hypothetical protein
VIFLALGNRGFFLTVPPFWLFAQVGINDENTPPANSAMLDVQSTTKGMLIPRMTNALRSAISSPVNGLMIYQTDGVIGFYYYNGTIWQRIGETDGSETKVTAGANVTVTGTGTSAIVAQAGAGSTYAAGLCDAYTNDNYGTGVFSDWYLPSRGELNDLWNSIKAVQKALDSDGNSATTAITQSYYWSSTEYNYNYAWFCYLYNGKSINGHKNTSDCVRAVRAF